MNLHRNISAALSLMLFALAAAPTFAKSLSPQEALQRLRRQSSTVKLAGKSPAAVSYDLSYTGQEDGTTALYVFNKDNKGFIVTSADDRLPAILGYSDNGIFDFEAAPTALKWWLSEYAKEAAGYLSGQAILSPVEPLASAPTSRHKIDPLIKSKWDQHAPFYNKCPIVNSKHSVTGCVATAMAQIINYHKYANGTGTHEYNWNGQTLSYDFGASSFDFDNILDKYYGSETNIENEAVAELMYACGVSVDMNYSPNGSGAYDALVAYALRNYFGYDDGVRTLTRECFSSEEWEELIYTEIAENRPVIYAGQSDKGGHEFICDGYEDGYFHINWGWMGLSDGNFLLSSLNPDKQGTGGFEGGYNFNQAITIGIQPPTSGASIWHPIYLASDFSLNNEGNHLLIDSYIYNHSSEDLEITLVIKAVSQDRTTYYSNTSRSFTLKGMEEGNFFRYHNFSFSKPTNIPAGTYKASLAIMKEDGTYQDILFPRQYTSFSYMTVDVDGKVSFAQASPLNETKLIVTSFYVEPNPIQSGVATQTRIGIENLTDVAYTYGVTLKIYPQGSEINPLKAISLTTKIAPKGSSSPNSYFPLQYDLDNGTYDVVFYDFRGNKISNPFKLVMGSTTVAPTDIGLDLATLELNEKAAKKLSATISPTNVTDKSVAWISSDESVATVDNSGLVTAIKEGSATITATSANRLIATCEVTVTGGSTPSPVLPENGIVGDFNNNGEYDVKDVTILVDHILHIENDPAIVAKGDLNGNHELDVNDVTRLVELILKKDR
ncbi:MAG: C10 family peptidase [Pseudoflavonifractor sp.]|nr:C10 family peptidase [Alloprevotella sp.]MCM1116521.1 C10 family peptidase [Pseudoflavonifractor sp.]